MLCPIFRSGSITADVRHGHSSLDRDKTLSRELKGLGLRSPSFRQLPSELLSIVFSPQQSLCEYPPANSLWGFGSSAGT